MDTSNLEIRLAKMADRLAGRTDCRVLVRRRQQLFEAVRVFYEGLDDGYLSRDNAQKIQRINNELCDIENQLTTSELLKAIRKTSFERLA